jgi:hypothetical protein
VGWVSGLTILLDESSPHQKTSPARLELALRVRVRRLPELLPLLGFWGLELELAEAAIQIELIEAAIPILNPKTNSKP